ncbi:Lipoprotein, partial [Dysosmobacter welbionis]
SSGSRWSGPRTTPGAGARRRPSASSGTPGRRRTRCSRSSARC